MVKNRQNKQTKKTNPNTAQKIENKPRLAKQETTILSSSSVNELTGENIITWVGILLVSFGILAWLLFVK